VEWFLSNATVGVVTWLGTTLTVIGLALTFWQAWRARQAAESAESKVSRLRIRIDAANTAYSSAELNTFLHMVHSGDFALAQAFFSPLKRSLRLQARSDSTRADDSEALNRAIGAIDGQLEKAVAQTDQYNPARLRRAVDGILDTVSRWEAELRNSSG
jgi:hypothetical protein